MSSEKTNLFAFRCDDDLADLLAKSDNRSETIVRALREHFLRKHAVTCPTCNGSGEVYAPIKKPSDSQPASYLTFVADQENKKKHNGSRLKRRMV